MPLYLRKLPDVFGDVPIRDLGYMASEGRGRDAARQLRRGGRAQRHEPLLRVRARGAARRSRTAVPDLRRARVEPRVLHLLHDLGRALPLRHQRRRPRRRLLPQHARDPVRAQGPGHDLDHRREADRVAGDGGACSRSVESGGYDVEHFTAAVRVGRAAALRVLRRARRLDDDRARPRVPRAPSTARSAEQNIEYEAKRESQRLGAPVLRRVAPGTYQALRQKRVAEGAPEAQVKIPQLSTDMEFGAELDVLEEVRLDG